MTELRMLEMFIETTGIRRELVVSYQRINRLCIRRDTDEYLDLNKYALYVNVNGVPLYYTNDSFDVTPAYIDKVSKEDKER